MQLYHYVSHVIVLVWKHSVFSQAADVLSSNRCWVYLRLKNNFTLLLPKSRTGCSVTMVVLASAKVFVGFTTATRVCSTSISSATSVAGDPMLELTTDLTGLSTLAIDWIGLPKESKSMTSCGLLISELLISSWSSSIGRSGLSCCSQERLNALESPLSDDEDGIASRSLSIRLNWLSSSLKMESRKSSGLVGHSSALKSKRRTEWKLFWCAS